MNFIKKSFLAINLIVAMAIFAACNQAEAPAQSQPEATTQVTVSATPSEAVVSATPDAEASPKGLVLEKSMELQFSDNFSVDYYEGGYKFLKVKSTGESVFISESGEIPSEMPEGSDENTILVLSPLENMLVSTTPVMSFITRVGGVDKVKLTSYEADYWHIEQVKEKMKNGEMGYVGEYNALDYESIAAAKPDMSIFSNMIGNSPEVLEKLAEIDVPVINDQSSLEKHPLARLEWIKFYAALINEEDAAQAAFDEQVEIVENLAPETEEKKTVSVFYITSKGGIYVRNAGDYMAKMVDLSGGEYILKDLNPDSSGTTQMEPEAFYAANKDADFVIYIFSMGGRPRNLADFLERNEILADLKAVEEGNVWCTTPDFFQISDTLGYMIEDINEVLYSENPQPNYLFRLE